MTPSRSEQGSIVIEALVATLILAAIAGALFETSAAAAGAARATADRRRALLVAQSALASLPLEAGVPGGVTTGRSDELSWTMAARPYPQDGDSTVGGLDLVTVTVRAGASDRPLATLRTLRLAQ